MNIPDTVTVSCPIKEFRQRYVIKGCTNCEYFTGVSEMTNADELDLKDPITGQVVGKRPINWHEKYVIRCAFPMTRRCADMSVAED